MAKARFFWLKSKEIFPACRVLQDLSKINGQQPTQRESRWLDLYFVNIYEGGGLTVLDRTCLP
jgi:hypothetical protein